MAKSSVESLLTWIIYMNLSFLVIGFQEISSGLLHFFH